MLIKIQEDPINIDAMIDSLRSEDSGAIVTFLGTVRNNSGDLMVKALFYECYYEMAIKMIGEIVAEARHKFMINDAAVTHRIGLVGITEDSVAVCVSAAHRLDAFRACEFIIDGIKKKVPIWKKDITDDGSAHWRD